MKRPDLLHAMQVFTTVVESGSFAGAADRLELSRAMVTRQVAQLEAHLGVRLLHRTTRRMSLTEAGSEYHRRALQVLALVEESADTVRRQAQSPGGELRVSSSVGFGSGPLSRVLGGFLARYPRIHVDLVMSEAKVDLVDEGFDVAVRVATELDPGLVARRLARVRTLACAAPDYLRQHGVPGEPQDLAAHHCMAYAHRAWRSEWLFTHNGQSHAVPIAGRLRANYGSVLIDAAIEGRGIVLEPEFLVCDALAAGRLVRVLPDWYGPELAVFAVYPERHYLPLKVRCFVDYLAQVFGSIPPWERWSGGPGSTD